MFFNKNKPEEKRSEPVEEKVVELSEPVVPKTKIVTDTFNSLSVIGKDMTIDGEVRSDSDVKVEGNINGSLIAKNKAIVSSSGNLNGDINCKDAEVSGKVEGKINSKGLVVLKSTAVVVGEITTSQIQIDPGAKLHGSCSMMGLEEKKPAVKSSGNVKKEELKIDSSPFESKKPLEERKEPVTNKLL